MIRPPFGSDKRANYYTRKRATAARRKVRRQTKGKRSGRRTWMHDWPVLHTQKGGKNKGRPPTYSTKPYIR